MTLWRLELLRIVRTRRWLALLGVYVLFGFIGPLTARYIDDIVSLTAGDSSGVTIEFPPATPADGIAQYVSNAAQIGTLVTVVVAAAALAFDSVEEMGVFLRTRVTSMWTILAPRLVVPFAAASLAYVLGVLTAWYETAVLIGPIHAKDVGAGAMLGVVFLAFVVSLVAAVAQWMRSTLSTVLVSVVVLLVLPIIGAIGTVGDWLPTSLSGALAGLTSDTSIGHYAGTTAVTVIASVALVVLAISGASRREL